MQTLKILYNKKIYHITDDENNVTVKDFLLANTTNISVKTFQDIDKYIVLVNGQITDIHNNKTLKNVFECMKTQFIIIELNVRMKGGGIFEMFESIIAIGKVFTFLGDIILWFFKFVGWLFLFIIWLIKYIFKDLIGDFIYSIKMICFSILRLPLDLFMALATMGTNTIGDWILGFWGWDQSNLTPNDRNSKYFTDMNRSKGKKCYLTNNGTVPFSILLGTVLCPPIGVFMDLGATGWFIIFICTLLTLVFYIPGLVYALMIIYS